MDGYTDKLSRESPFSSDLVFGKLSLYSVDIFLLEYYQQHTHSLLMSRYLCWGFPWMEDYGSQ